MLILEEAKMSNIIPPMISNSPPPLDLEADDNEDDGFGDFRVAADLDLSDSSMGRDSPDVWNTPSTNSEPSDDHFLKADRTPAVKSVNSDYFDAASDLENKANNTDVIKVTDTIVTDNVESINNSVDKEIKFHESDEVEIESCPAEKESDPPEVIEELSRIPFSPVFTSCDAELEARTSPEGADAESIEEAASFPTTYVESDEKAEKHETNSLETTLPELKLHENVDDGGDDFSDFADFSSQPFPQETEPSPPVANFVGECDSENLTPGEVFKDDNDFDDFDDFECAVPNPHPNETRQDVGLNDRLATIFQDETAGTDSIDEDPELTGCLNSCLDDSSSVWGHLKDLETSHALTLQWTSCTASKKLLSSLSVDSRNILIGPRWNSSMPRFAANLGCTPLEPMKAPPDEALPPTVRAAPSVTPPVTEEVVPAAQFDWNSSGLTNPLDCLEKEEAPGDKQSSKLMESSLNLNPKDQPHWQPPILTGSDILLPMPLDNFIPLSQSKTKTTETNDPQAEWLRDSSLLETDNSPVEMETISSHLEMLGVERDKKAVVEPEPTQILSPEACRVVEALPDLSFLSARNLLYAANKNMTRFQAKARP